MTLQKSSPPISNGMLPPTSKSGGGKCTTASTVLELIKDVEIAISSRKGRMGTAAGDVAFPKGKEIWRLFSNVIRGGYPTNPLALMKDLVHARSPLQLHTTYSILR